jgi:glucose dehydrogenase
VYKAPLAIRPRSGFIKLVTTPTKTYHGGCACGSVRYDARLGRVMMVAAMSVPLAAAAHAQDWPAYGGDAGGSRLSGAAQITKANVAGLALAWNLSHRRAGTARRAAFKRSTFQVTPIVADGKLLFCTPFDRVVR